MADVQSLFGGKIRNDGVNQDVIDKLRGLLEEAERGDIIAFAIAFLDGVGVSNSLVVGSAGRTNAMGGSICMLQYRYFHEWMAAGD